jgi:hypothetical protein
MNWPLEYSFRISSLRKLPEGYRLIYCAILNVFREEVDNENQFSNAIVGEEFSLVIDRINGVHINVTD